MLSLVLKGRMEWNPDKCPGCSRLNLCEADCLCVNYDRRNTIVPPCGQLSTAHYMLRMQNGSCNGKICQNIVSC